MNKIKMVPVCAAWVERMKKLEESQRWVPVGGIVNLPPGEWVVRLEDGSHHVAKAQGFIVGGIFHFDRKPVVAYAALPTKPVEGEE